MSKMSSLTENIIIFVISCILWSSFLFSLCFYLSIAVFWTIWHLKKMVNKLLEAKLLYAPVCLSFTNSSHTHSVRGITVFCPLTQQFSFARIIFVNYLTIFTVLHFFYLTDLTFKVVFSYWQMCVVLQIADFLFIFLSFRLSIDVFLSICMSLFLIVFF